MRNMSTRTKPDGNALSSIVERFITEARKKADSNGSDVKAVIQERLRSLSELAGGYDFAQVIAAYWRGHEEDNEQLIYSDSKRAAWPWDNNMDTACLSKETSSSAPSKFPS